MEDKRKERRKCFESSKERKRRLWRERQQNSSQRTQRPAVCSDWMFLPDLVLEHIFTFLSYKV